MPPASPYSAAVANKTAASAETQTDGRGMVLLKTAVTLYPSDHLPSTVNEWMNEFYFNVFRQRATNVRRHRQAATGNYRQPEAG